MNRRARTVLVSLAALIAMAVTVSLGRWQLQRAADKLALQASIDAQASAPALDTTAVLHASAWAPLLHQPAVLQGRWDVQHTVFLDNRQMQGRVGFFVMTPLLLDGAAQAIVVQRGWIPRDFEHRNRLQPVQTPEGLVVLRGHIAPAPSKLYQPGAEEPGPIRQNLDLTAFQAETGHPLLPVTVQQSGAASEGLLRDWPVVDAGVEKHYGYAAQWFAMATLVAGLYLWFIVIRPRFTSSAKSAHHVP